MKDRTKVWADIREQFERDRVELISSPVEYAKHYMQQPVLEPWQKDAVKTITGWDIASPDGDWSVRWNDKIGRYERKGAKDKSWRPL